MGVFLESMILCSDNGAEQISFVAATQTPTKENDMDRRYRLKMEDKLNTNTLTKEYILNCIAKHEKKINDLAYKEKQYRSSYYNNHKLELDKLIEYRQPFVDVLMKEYRMSLEDIKIALQDVKDKNIPTNAVCNQIRGIITNGCYFLE